MFQECRRKYYFHYLYSQLPPDLRDETIYRNVKFLRKLTNRFMVMGQVLHDEIDRWIVSLGTERPLSLQTVIQRTWREFEYRYKFSFKEEYFYRPENDPHYTVLFEHIYRIPVTEVALGKLYQMVKKALRNLSLWPGLERIRMMDPRRIVYKEELMKGQFDEIPVWLKIDLGYRQLDGKLIIIDWKFSQAAEEKDPLQLAIYGAFARQQFPDHSGIELVNFYLLAGQEKRYLFTEDLHQRTRQLIVRSHQQMVAFHQQAARGNMLGQLPAQYREATCNWCNFRKICFPRGFPSALHAQRKHLTLI